MTPLDQMEENQQVKVMEIHGGWGVRRRLGQLGIHPGDVITVVRYGAFQGPILIQIHGSQVALGRGIASRILVKESE